MAAWPSGPRILRACLLLLSWGRPGAAGREGRARGHLVGHQPIRAEFQNSSSPESQSPVYLFSTASIFPRDAVCLAMGIAGSRKPASTLSRNSENVLVSLG